MPEVSPDARDAPAQPADVRDYLRPLWTRKWLILATVLIATLGVFAYYSSQPKQYTASTDIFLKASVIDRTLFDEATASDERNVRNQAELLTTVAVARQVAQQIGFSGDPGALLNMVTAQPSPETDFVEIVATAGSPQDAARLANGFAAAFVELRAQAQRRDAQAALEVAREQLERTPETEANLETRSDLADQIRALLVAASTPGGSAEQIDRAVPPGFPSAPQVIQNTIFAFALSLLLAVGVAFGLERFDRRLKRIDDVEAVYRAPVLGVLSSESEPAPMPDGVATVPRRFVEPLRMLSTNLQLEALDQPLRTLVVTSALQGEGKSTVVRNLALTLFESGSDVAVVECDLRRPTMGKLLWTERAPGLTDVLLDLHTLVEALQTIQVSEAATTSAKALSGEGSRRLRVLSAGTHAANPGGVLRTSGLDEILAELRESFDVVLIDTPPLLAVSDTIPLVERADGVLLVSRLGETTRDAAGRATDLLDRVPSGRVVGVVINEAGGVLSADAYGYYGYYADSQKEPGSRRNGSRRRRSPVGPRA